MVRTRLTIPPLDDHLQNVASNLQLLADLAYADVALALRDAAGHLAVAADARPNTAIAPIAASRAGTSLDSRSEPEAYAALGSGAPEEGGRARTARGIPFSTSAYPVGTGDAILVINTANQVRESAGAMESAFMEAAAELIDLLRAGPLLDVRTGEPFSTHRDAGDGALRINEQGEVVWASPNAVNILRLAGREEAVVGVSASELPGGGFGIAPTINTSAALSTEAEVTGRTFLFRSIGLARGAFVLVRDITEAKRRDAELKVKDATIREVHHRVKNNLQTIASLLRMQARRTSTDDARIALAEATERVSAMAVVHDLLAVSEEERLDFAQAARTVVALVERSLLGERSGIAVTVDGESGMVDAKSATSLALALAELVHNAIEHGMGDRANGVVHVQLRRVPEGLVIGVRDDGVGLPAGFDLRASSNLGLDIVRTVVEDDLRGTITFSGGRGTTVTVRVPLAEEVQ